MASKKKYEDASLAALKFLPSLKEKLTKYIKEAEPKPEPAPLSSNNTIQAPFYIQNGLLGFTAYGLTLPALFPVIANYGLMTRLL